MALELAIGMPRPLTLLIVLGVILLLFSSRIPRVARNLGSVFRNFRAGLDGEPTDRNAKH